MSVSVCAREHVYLNKNTGESTAITTWLNHTGVGALGGFLNNAKTVL